jgi:pimeloyl-ACP methyl ester carboxylesterase
MTRRLCFALAAALLLAAPPAHAAPLPQRTEAFQPAECMFDLPPGFAEGQDVECGYLTVPARHAEPAAGDIRLAVAIIKALGANRKPDPLVMMQGGPGGSTIDTYTQLLASPNALVLRNERDIVLFDQRGTLHSEPSLLCPEQIGLVEDTIERRLTREENLRLSLEVTEACRARLVAEGVDLAAFNSLENAADVEALRVALGYEQINLYGVSYGTQLAQHVMRLYPEGLRSVTLDAVVPLSLNVNGEIAQSAERALGELFAACAADAACDRAYPELEQVFFDTVDRLNQEPARVPVTDAETGRTFSAVLDGDSLYQVIFQLLYASEILPALPKIIYDARDDEFGFLAERLLPLILFDRTIAIGMYSSVTCAEDADLTLQDLDLQGVRPQIADNAELTTEFLLQSCAIWDVPALDPGVDAALTSDIPTLLLSGRFDPITPPPYADIVAEGLGNSFGVVFGDGGHGQIGTRACPNSVLLSFLNDPETQPEWGCAAELQAPAFITPETLLLTPAAGRLLSALEPANLWQLAVLAISLLILLSPFLIWPLAWLIRLVSARPTTGRRAGGGWARALVLLAGLLALIFVAGLVVIVGLEATSGSISIAFGFPLSSRPLFYLPLIIAALALLIWLAAVLAWTRGYWSGLGRVYYTLLALAAAGFVGVLALWGMLRVVV